MEIAKELVTLATSTRHAPARWGLTLPAFTELQSFLESNRDAVAKHPNFMDIALGEYVALRPDPMRDPCRFYTFVTAMALSPWVPTMSDDAREAGAVDECLFDAIVPRTYDDGDVACVHSILDVLEEKRWLLSPQSAVRLSSNILVMPDVHVLYTILEQYARHATRVSASDIDQILSNIFAQTVAKQGAMLSDGKRHARASLFVEAIRKCAPGDDARQEWLIDSISRPFASVESTSTTDWIRDETRRREGRACDAI